MSISSALTALNQDIQNARTAIVNKGGTITSGGGSSQLATDIATIPNRDVDITPVAFYDDSGNKIGCYYMNFTDNDGIVYKVIILEALNNGYWCSSKTAVTNMPSYSSYASQSPWNAKETATQNTQLILDYCSANGFNSTACEFCRSFNYTINNIVYYGQLPNIIEVQSISKKFGAIKKILPSLAFRQNIVSTQANAGANWYMSSASGFDGFTKTLATYHYTVLEIPL